MDKLLFKTSKKNFYGFLNSMIKISIDKSKTFLPLNIAKGTTEQRLQKARLLNLKFYDNLQYEIIKREIKPAAFKRTLKSTAGAKIGIDIFNAGCENASNLTFRINKDRKIKGFSFFLPLEYWTGNIRQSLQTVFLRETQKFFNEICNPKFAARKLTIYNKFRNLSEVDAFYAQNINGKNELKNDILKDFLSKRSDREKIDILQYLRYTLQCEQNIKKAEYQVDRHIEKAENLKFINKNYDLTDYKYDKKFELLEKELKDIIKSVRQK